MTIANKLYARVAPPGVGDAGALHALRTAMSPVPFGYFRRVLTERLRMPLVGTSVLDVGCGGGALAEQFARLGCLVTAVHPSWSSLEAARWRAQRQKLDIFYLHGSAEDLPVEDRGFNVVCCWDVLEHVADLRAMVAEVERVLRPGGVFLYGTINRTAASKLVVIKLMQDWEWSSIVPPDTHDWSKFIMPEELDARLRYEGLEPREVVGLKPAASLLRVIKAMRDLKRGKITHGEFGRRVQVEESASTAISYVGFALKPRWR